MAERLKAPVLKTGKGATLSWVRIPVSPPSLIIFKINHQIKYFIIHEQLIYSNNGFRYREIKKKNYLSI